jgi:hypothetical protein
MISFDDLFSEDLNESKRWNRLKQVMTVRILGDKKTIKTAFMMPIEAV